MDLCVCEKYVCVCVCVCVCLCVSHVHMCLCIFVYIPMYHVCIGGQLRAHTCMLVHVDVPE